METLCYWHPGGSFSSRDEFVTKPEELSLAEVAFVMSLQQTQGLTLILCEAFGFLFKLRFVG